MKVCPSCGTDNGEAAGFCSSCGEFLDWDRPGDVAVSDHRAAWTPSQRVQEPPDDDAKAAEPEAAVEAVTPAEPIPSAVPDTPDVATAASSETEQAARAEAERRAEERVRAGAERAQVASAARARAEAQRQADETRRAAEAEQARIVEAERRAEERARAEAERAQAESAARARAEAQRQADETRRAAEAEQARIAEQRRAERMRKLVAGNAPVRAPVPIDEERAPAEAAAAPPVAPLGPATPAMHRAPIGGSMPPAATSGSLASVITIAERGGRTDLSSRLKATREGLDRTAVTIAVVGEYKKGKSNLVNALVNAEVCPSDPVFATVVPIVVRYADEMSTTVELLDDTSRPLAGLDHLAEVASETGNLDNHLQVARVEVGLPRRLLATGLVFVDTPGVGGLDSALGSLVLARLASADGVLFATDCSQELTAPELAYLLAARERCDAVVCVMTKRDLHIHADALVATNRRHLDAAGLADVPIVAVSSLLHLLALAETDPALEDESGFAGLFDAIHHRIWEPARARGVAAAGVELAHVATHLAIPIEAEREAARSPEAAAQTIDRLSEVQDRVRQFRTASARWQQRLNEGTQDTLNDVDHELQQRMRALTRTAEGRADAEAANPAEDLVFEVWLHKAAMDSVIELYQSIRDRMGALAGEIAELFEAFDREAGFRVEVESPAERIAGIHVVRETSPIKDSTLRRVITTSQGYSSGIVLASSLFALINPIAWLPLLTVPIAGFMARRAFSDDRARRRAVRSQELKRLATRYVDEIRFVVQKDARDTIRGLRREILEHYLERTEQLERTLQQAIVAASQVRDGQATVPTDAHEATIRQMRSTAARLVAAGAKAS